jgi:hypothetical protein
VSRTIPNMEPDRGKHSIKFKTIIR